MLYCIMKDFCLEGGEVGATIFILYFIYCKGTSVYNAISDSWSNLYITFINEGNMKAKNIRVKDMPFWFMDRST